MRLRIHRGAHEIGGNCVEVESQGYSILLDLGLPLSARAADPSFLPDVAGLADGLNPHLLGIILSHTHGDHCGLTGLAHGTIPVFMGARAKTVLLASQLFVRQLPPKTIRPYQNQRPFDLGPFRITPYLVDHSAFDAYGLLVEADNRKLLYSGDLRAHGRKRCLFDQLLSDPPPAVDVLLLEGTTLSRPEGAQPPETEHALEDRMAAVMTAASGLVLTAFSPQNIDRFVTVFRAARRSGRTFVADMYLAHVLDQLALPSLPSPSDMRVYLPTIQKRQVVTEQRFDIVSRFRAPRIFPEEIAATPHKWAMLFRTSMMSEVERLPLGKAVVIYSLWPGYLAQDDGRFASWCRHHDAALEIVHTSGHADQESLIRLARAINSGIVVPIHTKAPDVMAQLLPNVHILPDRTWLAA
jgi:ribonuclease J